MTLCSASSETASRALTTQKNGLPCPFYTKIGACRHGGKCSRSHTVPPVSKTVILKNFHCGLESLFRPDCLREEAQREFDEFYVEVFNEINEKYGQIDEMIVCDNVCEHMIGNVYIRFGDESHAQQAVDDLNNRWFDGRPIHCELSPVKDFKTACCRQYEAGECERGKFCNFLHLKKVSSAAKRKLWRKRGRPSKKRSKPKPGIKAKRTDDSIPKRYQYESSSDDSSWTHLDNAKTKTSQSPTPMAFREDRYPSDVSDPESEPDPVVTAHMQMLRKQKWEELRNRLGIRTKWDDDRERNFVFSLL